MPVIEEPTSVFQLTTSHRGRPGSSIVDYEDSISTHYLTQRQTGFPVPLLPIFPFQLTTSHRGRLSSPRAPAPADIFQLTTSHRGRPCPAQEHPHRQTYFNSLPHTEVDYRLHLLLLHHLYFNSLPHTEVDVGFSVNVHLQSVFQLTTSHRGRPSVPISIIGLDSFQLTTSHRGRHRGHL